MSLSPEYNTDVFTEVVLTIEGMERLILGFIQTDKSTQVTTNVFNY